MVTQGSSVIKCEHMNMYQQYLIVLCKIENNINMLPWQTEEWTV